jgi:mevalonate kinase
MKKKLWKEIDSLNKKMNQINQTAETAKQNGDIETLKNVIRNQQQINKRYLEVLPLLDVLEVTNETNG